ncbi:hypothetical protein EVAR_102737_1 [Eumeta japonica]|uniref:Uncharacterized protein n=1 Tax=Eumeta variegata TaxID=151549 RepID=A0A4C1TIN8_EUMVA|nr:hypothetical protein EVAR_102737_1 [Eumeta japonica]
MTLEQLKNNEKPGKEIITTELLRAAIDRKLHSSRSHLMSSHSEVRRPRRVKGHDGAVLLKKKLFVPSRFRGMSLTTLPADSTVSSHWNTPVKSDFNQPDAEVYLPLAVVSRQRRADRVRNRRLDVLIEHKSIKNQMNLTLVQYNARDSAALRCLRMSATSSASAAVSKHRDSRGPEASSGIPPAPGAQRRDVHVRERRRRRRRSPAMEACHPARNAIPKDTGARVSIIEASPPTSQVAGARERNGGGGTGACVRRLTLARCSVQPGRSPARPGVAGRGTRVHRQLDARTPTRPRRPAAPGPCRFIGLRPSPMSPTISRTLHTCMHRELGDSAVSRVLLDDLNI